MSIEPEQLSAADLSTMLAANIDEVTQIERIGTGQMSRNYRLSLRGDGPASVVVKVPATEQAVRELGATAYKREVFFYADIAHTLDAGVAACRHHQINDDGTDFLLILDDLAPASQGDQLDGCSVDDARRAITNLAAIHAAGWNNDAMLAGRTFERSDGSLLDTFYPVALDEFLNRYADRLRDGTAEVLGELRTAAGAWSGHRPGPQSIVHGDYRLDNLLFTASSVVAVDWQTVACGPPARDLAYFLGNSLTTEDRTAAESALLDHYLAELSDRGIDYSAEALAGDYAIGGWLGPLVTVVGAFVATRTDRGDDMFIAMADRCAAQLIEHDAVARLAALG